MNGTVIVISTLCPGASTPLDGLNPIFPGTFVEATQCKLLCASALESTLAKQTYVEALLQSRCPTILIDDGRTLRIAGAGCWVGCGVTTGCGVDVGCGVVVGFGVEVGVNVGAVVGVLDGTTVTAGVGDA